MKQIKDNQMHLRCTSDDKKEVKRILKDINKKSDFLITYFINEFNTKTSRLKLDLSDIDAELKAIDDKIIELQERRNKLDDKRNLILEELNNTSLYDLDNYKNNDAVMGAIGSIRDMVLERKITNFNSIPNNIFYEINKTFKVNDMELLKEISANEFEKWQHELKATVDDDKESDISKMRKMADKLQRQYKGQYRITNWQDFLKTKENFLIKRCKSEALNYEELMVFLNKRNYTHDD